MTAPGLQVINYPVQIEVTAGQTGTFTFPTVPTGQCWTFGLFFDILAQQFGSPLTVWQLLRNGQPEMNWVGQAVLTDVQAQSGDTISVTLTTSDIAAFGETLFATMKGRAESPATFEPTSPKVYQLTEQNNPATLGAHTSSASTGNTSVSVPFSPVSAGLLIGVQLGWAVQAPSTATQDAEITVTAIPGGTQFVRQGVVVAPSGVQSGSVYVPVNNGEGILVAGTDQLELVVGAFAAGAARLISAVAYWGAQ